MCMCMYILPKSFGFGFGFCRSCPMPTFPSFGYWQQEIFPRLPQKPFSPELAGSVRIGTEFNCDRISPGLFLYPLGFKMSSVNSGPRISKRSEVLATSLPVRKESLSRVCSCDVCNVGIKWAGPLGKHKQASKQTETLCGGPLTSFNNEELQTATQEPLIFRDSRLAKPASVLHAFKPLTHSIIFFPFFLSEVTGNCVQN